MLVVDLIAFKPLTLMAYKMRPSIFVVAMGSPSRYGLGSNMISRVASPPRLSGSASIASVC